MEKGKANICNGPEYDLTGQEGIGYSTWTHVQCPKGLSLADIGTSPEPTRYTTLEGFYNKKIVCSRWNSWKLLDIAYPGITQNHLHPEFTQAELDALGEYESGMPEEALKSLACWPSSCAIPVGLVAPFF